MSKLTDGILALSKESADKKKIEFKISITEVQTNRLDFFFTLKIGNFFHFSHL